MSKAEQNKAVVGRWFTEFWGKSVDLGVVDQIAAPDNASTTRHAKSGSLEGASAPSTRARRPFYC